MTAYSEDFTEIAHCGGQATFAVRCDENGALSIATGFRGSSPGPMVMIAIYATVPQGFPVSDVEMGGIGQAFKPSCPPGCNRPDFYYVSETQQTRFNCVKCGEFNDIRGLYGYCASCGHRNNMASINDSLQKLRSGLVDKSIAPDVVVSRAVSAFDASCRDMINQLRKRIPMKPARTKRLERLIFHDIESPTFNEIKSAFEVDLLRGIDSPTIEFLKMMLERRHVYEHMVAWRMNVMLREAAILSGELAT
jgi:hypothetical protein